MVSEQKQKEAEGSLLPGEAYEKETAASRQDLEKPDRDLWERMQNFQRKMDGARILPLKEAGMEEDDPPAEKIDIDTGLTHAQVLKRIAAGAVNRPVESASKSTREIIYSNVFTYYNLVFFVLTVLLCVVRSFRDLTFLIVVVANTGIGIAQELRAKKVLDELRIISTPRCRVIRDGREQRIGSDEVVTDDIVLLEAGRQIAADMTVAEGTVWVNESLLTGESDQIEKRRGDQLLSGSFVVSGSCRARVERVGEQAFAARLTLEAKKMNKGEISEMVRSLDRLVRWIGIIIIPIGLVLFGQQHFINGADLRDSVTSTVAAILGMIPEGLYLLASVAMVVSVMRLAMQKVLVHNMKCIETLARVDVLCVDKTGTLTDSTMEVKALIPWRTEKNTDPAGKAGEPKKSDKSKESVKTEESEEPEESAESIDSAETKDSAEEQAGIAPELLIGDFVSAMTADNITMKALKERFRRRTGRRPDQVIPFQNEWKYCAERFGEEAYVLGAPETVLGEAFESCADRINEKAALGYRVLIFARYHGELDGKALTHSAVPLGMILLSNPVRQGASETFAYFAAQQVQIKVISGDNPRTVSEVAKEAGIRDADSWVDVSALETEEAVRAAAISHTVFGRVSPDRKKILVDALKKAGHTVAMTGDGVNDVLAMKEADCSIAMATGSEAASQVAQLVLLESDFSRMPSVVAEGRRVVNNIERTASLFLVKNIFSLFLSLFTIILTINYPMEPSQISLVSMFTIGIPAFLLSQENNTDPIRGHFISNVLFKALPGGITDFLIVSAMYLFCLEFGLSEEELSTSCTILLGIVGLIVLYQIASPMTRIHWIIWAGMAAGLIYSMIFVSNLFAITTISKRCMMLLALFAIVTEPTFRYLRVFCQKLAARRRSKNNYGF